MVEPIGIDLGTTWTCVSQYKNGRTEVIRIDGQRLLKSCVFFSPVDKSAHVGNAGENECNKVFKWNGKTINAVPNLLYDAKRFLGRDYKDPNIQQLLRQYRFKSKSDPGGKVLFGYNCKDNDVWINPEKVSAEVLKKIKSSLNQEKVEAVITIPAYFGNDQRQATLNAAKNAGIDVLQLMTEPTAAALHYFLNCEDPKEKAIVFDMGGGTLDLSIIDLSEMKTTNDTMAPRKMKVLGVGGDSNLGGRDIDNIIEKHFEEILSKKGVEINDRLSRRLKNYAERCKKSLSENDSFAEPLVLQELEVMLTLARGEFEQKCSKIFEKCLDCLTKCLNNAKLKKTDIKQVILAGGSSRIPKLRQMIKNFFDKIEIKQDNDFDEIISLGAGYYAHLLKKRSGNSDEIINNEVTPDTSVFLKEDVLISNLVPVSIGMELKFDYMETLVEGNQSYPFKTEKRVVTTTNNQQQISLRLYQGDSKYIHNNQFITELNIFDLPKRPAGGVTVNVIFTVDENGIINFKAQFEDAEDEIKLNSDTLRNPIDFTKKRELDEDIFEAIVKAKTIAHQFAMMHLNGNTDNDKRTAFEVFKEIVGAYDSYRSIEDFEKMVTNSLSDIKYEYFKDGLRKNLQKLGLKI